jgi:hypothetical protein
VGKSSTCEAMQSCEGCIPRAVVFCYKNSPRPRMAVA